VCSAGSLLKDAARLLVANPMCVRRVSGRCTRVACSTHRAPRLS
jgi:hypothetical protein